MLDFSRLQTPDEHGKVLIEPSASTWGAAARRNHETLRKSATLLLGSTLSEWRRRTRQTIMGRDDVMVIVVGHQPEFLHAGVWAKRVVAARLAAAVEGCAVNLVVDHDAPRVTGLAVPSVRGGRASLSQVAIPQLPAGHPYEFMPRQSPQSIANFERTIRDALGERFSASQIPAFLEGLNARNAEEGWVGQFNAGLGAIESTFGISITERRVSSLPISPLLVDMLLNARHFAGRYNSALAAYRQRYRVRGRQRPIPDLRVDSDRCEVPVWAYRANEPRCRLFVRRADAVVDLFADDTQIGELRADVLEREGGLDDALAGLGGWQIRPRALALTIWARLLLADLFIHGIGGAKYDRISDTIINDYYGVTPPDMVCVSATLHLDLPYGDVTASAVRTMRRAIRDLTYNPQKCLKGGTDIDPLLEHRAAAVRQSEVLRTRDPRNRDARRAAFLEIRRLSRALVVARPQEVEEREANLARTLEQFEQGRMARTREYFFGLHDRRSLETLIDALPSQDGLRV